VLEGRRQQLGNSHPNTLSSVNNLAMLLDDQGKRAEAEPLYREAVNGMRKQLGPHRNTYNAMNNFALLLQDKGSLDEAESLFREALKGRRQVLGNSHADTFSSIGCLASLLHDRGELEKAEPLYREVLAGRRQKLGNTHNDTLFTLNNLALLLEERGKLKEAESLYREALKGRREQLGDAHPSTQTVKENAFLMYYLSYVEELEVCMVFLPLSPLCLFLVTRAKKSQRFLSFSRTNKRYFPMPRRHFFVVFCRLIFATYRISHFVTLFVKESVRDIFISRKLI